MDNDDLDEGEVDDDAKDNLKATILVFFFYINFWDPDACLTFTLNGFVMKQWLGFVAIKRGRETVQQTQSRYYLCKLLLLFEA